MAKFRPSLSYHLSFKTFVLSIFEWPLKTGFTVEIHPPTQRLKGLDFGQTFYLIAEVHSQKLMLNNAI